MTPFPAITLPKEINQQVLDKLAKPDETHEIHIIVRRVANAGPYKMRGRLRNYSVARDEKRGAHVLRVPLSVWMAGCPVNTMIQNNSVCYELTGTRSFTKSPLTFEMWKLETDEVAAEKVEDFPQPEMQREADDAFLAILEQLTSPPEVVQAFEMVRAGNVAALSELHAKLKEELERKPVATTKPAPMSAADRQRKRRERLQAEKEAAAKQLAHA